VAISVVGQKKFLSCNKIAKKAEQSGQNSQELFWNVEEPPISDVFFKRCPFFDPSSALRLWRNLSMWRPNQLSIDLKMDELLNQSIRKSIQYNPYLKPWVNPEDMRRDVRSGLSSSNLNAYLMAAQVRRTVISYHRKMTGPFGWTVDFSKINHHPGDPVTIDE
jgi:hypothetical protein